MIDKERESVWERGIKERERESAGERDQRERERENEMRERMR